MRDVPGLLTTGFAAYAKGVVPHHCGHAVRSINKPVEIGGITVHPGDIVHADLNGVIKVPSSCRPAELMKKAIRWRAYERDLHTSLRRTDLTAAEKRKLMADLFVEYGWAGEGI